MMKKFILPALISFYATLFFVNFVLGIDAKDKGPWFGGRYHYEIKGVDIYSCWREKLTPQETLFPAWNLGCEFGVWLDRPWGKNE